MTEAPDTAAAATVLSVVIPMYNEEEVLPALVSRLRPVLADLGVGYEVVAVDDGSTDRTAELLAAFRLGWPQLRVIGLRRNSGHQAALTAGLDRAHGAYVVSIDADLQDPPEKIPEMLRLARAESLDIVYGIRADRASDTGFKRWTAGLYYRLVRRLAGPSVPAQAGDFRLLSRAAVDALKALPDQQRVYRLLVPWLGFPSGEVTYERAPRPAGQSKYPLGRMIRLAVDSVTGFSAAPLRIATWLGGFAFLVCLGLMIYTLSAHAFQHTVPGWTSLFIGVLFIGAVQLVCVGLLGEYVGRIYTAVQNRPTYFVGHDTAAGAARRQEPRSGGPAVPSPAAPVVPAGDVRDAGSVGGPAGPADAADALSRGPGTRP
ncbi:MULTISPECIES: glycosyltransferase family 2 protein [Streptomyces]|uniref:glycosyltransferase family 2 protein n=1 Tax=Streptomyces TaxID=1883 RepID=UPI00190C2A56|nr:MULTISPECIES: glycosyltransferase family 2 protein [unclassified Streptomyces]MBK3623796.1 glycosyltransferase family 2 protein [Streptomyces sp. MBT49]MBK3631674.1 glycosyltransferase family 2 protein [Streptomyces sp. MBT97]